MPATKIINTNPHIIDILIKPNKKFPNSKLPLIIYREACELGKQRNRSAAAVQAIFNKHNWKNAWRNGIYNFHHYHGNTHECLGICSGKVKVIFGGPGGKALELKKGDVVIIPAGLAHKCVNASKDFLCVGAYPGGKEYDINIGTAEELEKAKPRIEKLSKPSLDPVFGKEGFLKTFWS